jgi:hypothetical protein
MGLERVIDSLHSSLKWWTLYFKSVLNGFDKFVIEGKIEDKVKARGGR